MTAVNIIESAFQDEAYHNEPQPITPEDAAVTLNAWNDEGICFPESLTPVLFSKCWNILCDSRR